MVHALTSVRLRARRTAVVSLAAASVGALAGCFPTSGNVSFGGIDDGGAADASPPAPADAGRIDASGDAGSALALPSEPIDFGAVACGTAAATHAITLTNGSSAAVSVAAAVAGAGFAVTPASLTIDAHASGSLSVTATVPTTTQAGASMAGTLTLTPSGGAAAEIPLTATPSGAALAFVPGEETTFAFPVSEVGYPAELSLVLANVGNAAATFSLGKPSDGRFAIEGDAGARLAPGASWKVNAGFTATDSSPVYATSAVTVSGVTCASSVESLAYSAQGTTGALTGFPASIDFGPADCGGAPPPEQTFTLVNTGLADAHIASVTFSGAPGFTTSAAVGRTIPAGGGELVIRVDAPGAPARSSGGPVTATLKIGTDTEASVHTISLSEEPNGAILAFDALGSTSFGDFGQVPLLGSGSQAFAVVNHGTGPAQVTLTTTPSPVFSVSVASFAIDGMASESETATFAPDVGGVTTGTLSMSATGVLCAPLPAAIALSGSSGARPRVTPTSLTFAATCGGAAPATQSFKIYNGGDGDMTWAMSSVTGSGSSRYTLAANPPPGTLIPGQTALVTVTAAPIPSPAPSTDPASFAAQVVITTDVPLDPDHVVTFGETPLGDQIAVQTPSPMRFGEIPIGTSVSQTLTVQNLASVGSPPASLTLAVSGTGAGAYTLVPSSSVTIAVDGGVTTGEEITFAPASAIPYGATLSFTTQDALCSALPAPVTLSGTGTQ
jgi:hypothetical protein